jgi:hypothetical protein
VLSPRAGLTPLPELSGRGGFGVSSRHSDYTRRRLTLIQGAMTMIKKKPRKVARNPYLTTSSPDDLGPTDRIAFDIISDRPDLLPSVERIMTAGLDGDATNRAINLFRESLESGSDPNRDPRVAIVNSTSPPTA